MASSRSDRAVEAPCMGTPPAMDTLVVLPLFLEDGPGVDARDVGFDFELGLRRPRSDTNEPVADGGSFEGWGGGVADFIGGALLGPPVFADVDVYGLPDMYSSCWFFLWYAVVPGASANEETCRGAGVWSGGFFFFGPRRFLGTASISELCPELGAVAEEVEGSARRALKEEMKSITWDESPRRLLKCSAASALERVDA